MKRLLTLTHDVLMAGLALQLTLWLRYGIEGLSPPSGSLVAVSVFMAVSLVVFLALGLSRGMWRFASVSDVNSVVVAATIVIVVFLFVQFALDRLDTLPRSAPPLTWFILIVLLLAPRLGYRFWKTGRHAVVATFRGGGAEAEMLVLIGTATEADQVIKTYNLERSHRYRLVGIVDYRREKVGRQVRGTRIIGALDDLTSIIERLRADGRRVDGLLLATSPERKDLVRKATAAAMDLGLPLRRIGRTPSIGAIEPDLEDITLDDLLGRPAAKLDLGQIASLIEDRVVLVTGAGGSIGSEIVRQVAALGPRRLLLVDHSEYLLYEIDREIGGKHPALPRAALLASVRDRARIRFLFELERPEVVFHAAALKHVPLVEDNVCEGALTNVVGSRNVADAALEFGARAVVMISTDKAIRPTSVMGACKRVAEAYCQALDALGAPTRFMTVRFGNVLGSAGSVVPLFKQQIAAGGPVTVTHPEMKRYFMTIREATELVLQAAAVGVAHEEQRGRIFVLDMGEPVRIVDLARTMISLAGFRPDADIEIRFSGLRPGEKLFEELFDADELTEPTAADGVYVAAARLFSASKMRRLADEIERAGQGGDGGQVRRLLAEVAAELPVDVHVAPVEPVEARAPRTASRSTC